MRYYLAIALALLTQVCAVTQAAEIRVATAANFRRPLLQITALFESYGQHSVKVSSASTGVIYNQILNGAPFDVFLAGDAHRPSLLQQQGLVTADSPFTYAWGQLVLAYRGQRPDSIASALKRPGITLAIANPKHAPYGYAAQQVLQRFELASDARLLRATNVGQAFRMWHSGSADLALIAPSFAPGQYLTIPNSIYNPIEQQAVVLQASQQPEAAAEFARFLRTPAAQQMIINNGYRVNDDD